MEEQLIEFETAKLAFEKGFDIQTNMLFVNYYTGNPEPPIMKWKNVSIDWFREQVNFMCTKYYRPTQSLLQKWIREEFGLYGYIDYSTMEAVIINYKNYEGKELVRIANHHFVVDWKTDEDLVEELLKATLKLINNEV